MRLADAANFFDRTVCADVYTPGETFLGQLGLFDDSMRDGTTVVRRVLSVGPDVAVPSRRTVTIHGETFIIGGVHKDSFDGAVIRQKYVLHRADGVAKVRTADQALRTLAGTDLYAGRLWVKDMKEPETSSRLTGFVDIYVSPSETVAAGSLVLLSNRWHIVRNSFIGAAGFLVCEADELDVSCLTTATYTARGAYDPATDGVGGSSGSVPILFHRWQDDYFYLRMAAEKFMPGDIVAHVSKTSVATAKAGDSFVLNAVTYQVLSARDDGANAWSLQARRD